MQDNSPNNSENIALLLQRALEGDSRAFDAVYLHYLTPIYRFVYLRVRNQHDAEDITQTVFVKAWDALPRFQDQGFPFSSYLYKIARNTVIDYWKKKKDVHLEDDQDAAHAIPDEQHNFVNELEIKDDARAIFGALHALNDEQQEVIMLRFVEDLSTKHIADIMERNEDAVRALQYRALKKLRDYLRTES
jgi:RNA polymerase sigma-70 factor, ECF subfamily